MRPRKQTKPVGDLGERRSWPSVNVGVLSDKRFPSKRFRFRPAEEPRRKTPQTGLSEEHEHLEEGPKNHKLPFRQQQGVQVSIGRVTCALQLQLCAKDSVQADAQLTLQEPATHESQRVPDKLQFLPKTKIVPQAPPVEEAHRRFHNIEPTGNQRTGKHARATVTES